MSYRIESIQFYVRETKPARFPSALGKAARSNQAPRHVTSPLCHARMIVTDDSGRQTFGCSADRLSVRWLDKRPGRSSGLKRRELGALIKAARASYLGQPEFESPFAQWRRCHTEIMQAGRKSGQEDLTSSFASALLERALLDAVCRLNDKSMFEMLREDQLGFRPGELHAELRQLEFPRILRRRPITEINIRHTVGLFDPLTDEDWPAERRLGDGLPETLKDYIDQQGIRYFKVKISGDVDADLKRLMRLWEILPFAAEPAITLDANEAFENLETFAQFVKRFEREHLGLFQHVLYIEQPLPRRLALADKAGKWIREIGKAKPVIIDESDGTVDSFRRALDLGYAGTSHKNCKGFFKSLTNLALAAHFAADGRETLLSAEDLQNLPVVPLQQDYTSVGILGLDHCERNGHHYNFGLSMLSDADKEHATRRHPDLYEQRDDEWFLRIRDGIVSCASLHGPGFGVVDEPDWKSMHDLDAWLNERHPAE
jgi:L-alanine-DL-glutamate epimerase-like enolase superfamily enzyme